MAQQFDTAYWGCGKNWWRRGPLRQGSPNRREAQRYDQRPFRSMLIQGWISYRPGRGFRITREGRQAWEEFERTEIWRKNPALPLTAYFDLLAYGLTTAGKSNLQVMNVRGAA
jgi:hypothetical protein